MRARVVGAALAAVLLVDLVLVGVRAGDDDPGPEGRPSPGPSASPTAAAVPTAPPVDVDDLEARLRDPEGFERVSDATSRLGALDAKAFGALFSASATEAEEVRTGLVALGFQTARGHLWLREGAFYGCVVIRFASVAGARALLASSAEETSAEQAFRSATVPGAQTYVEQADGLSVQHGVFARGRFVYEVTLTTPEPETDHARFDALLKLQRDHAEQSDP